MILIHALNYFLSKLEAYCKLLLCLSILYCSNGFAESTSTAARDLEQYKELFSQQQKEFEKQRKIIAEQGKEIEKLKSRLDSLSPKSETAKATSTKKTPTVAVNTEKSESSTKLPDKPVGKAPPVTAESKRPPEIPRVSDNVGGVLTRKGNLVIEPSLQYSYADNNRVFLDGVSVNPAFAIGLIDIRKIKRHSVFASLTARYGVTDRLELEFRVPYVYRADSQRSRPVNLALGQDEIFNATGNNIGDLEFSARYQLNDGLDGWPIFVGNMVTTIPTGTSIFDVDFVQSTAGAVFPTELATGSGYFSFQPSVSVLYPSDPGVFYGNVSYTIT